MGDWGNGMQSHTEMLQAKLLQRLMVKAYTLETSKKEADQRATITVAIVKKESYQWNPPFSLRIGENTTKKYDINLYCND